VGYDAFSGLETIVGGPWICKRFWEKVRRANWVNSADIFYQMSIRRGPKLMGNEFLMTLAVYMELKRIFMSVSRFAAANGIIAFPWINQP
jgi:hypothetical protein